MKQNKKNIAPALIAWLLLLSPCLLEGVHAKSLGLWLLAAVLWAPLLLLRPVRWLVVPAVWLLGLVNVVHVGFFGYLADQFFLATALRTTSSETWEFVHTLPTLTVVMALLWLLGSGWLGWTLLRWPAQSLRRSPLLRVACIASALVWGGFALYGAKKGYDGWGYLNKLDRVYPLHIVKAYLLHRQINAALFYSPQLPVPLSQPAPVQTLVVVIGESASAQRWSLLGYGGGDTNAPLRDIPGIEAIRVMAQGSNTAAALPFMLTGLSANDSVQQQAPSFLDVAHQAGFKTFVLTNSRFFDSQEDFFVQTLRRSADVYTKVGDGGDDDALTEPLRRALQDPATHKLVVLHTFGSHPDVKHRYPADYAALEDAYDNSLHYSSALLAKWTQLLDQSSRPGSPSLLVYSSDHGLVLPPCSEGYRTGLSRSTLEAPLLVWRNPALVATAEAAGMPRFSAQERETPLHGNSMVAQLVRWGVGDGAVPLQHAPQALQFQGRDWQAIATADRCSLE